MSRRALLTRTLLVVLMAIETGAPLLGADGELDPTWGTGGIGNGLDSLTARTAGASGAGFVPFTGVVPGASDELIHAYPEPPGTGGHMVCAGSWIAGGQRYEGRAMLEDRNGRLLIAGAVGVVGSVSTDRAFVARWSGSFCGSLDTGFHGVGWQIFDLTAFCDTESCRFIDIAEKQSGSTLYVLLLQRSVNFLRADYYLVGIKANGDLDTAFGNLGYAPVAAANFGNTIAGKARLVVDELDRIYVLHSHSDVDDPLDIDVGLTRFTPTGSRDNSYGSLGTQFIGASDASDEFVSALAIGPDGRIAAAWREEAINLKAILRVFPRGGGQTGSIGDYWLNAELTALLFDGLGRLTFAIDTQDSDGFSVNRDLAVFGVGLLYDPDFGSDGGVLIDIEAGGAGDEIPVALVSEGGKPYVLADADRGLGERTAIQVRLQNSLIFADGFEWGSTKFW